MQGKHWIDVVEAGYALEPAADAWFERVTDAARPLFDDARVLGGFVFSTRSGALQVDAVAVRGAPANGMARFEHLIRGSTRDALQLALGGGAPLFGTLSERLFAKLPAQEGVFLDTTERSIPDCQYVLAPSGTGSFLVLGASLSARRGSRASERTRWTRLAAHLGAGLRLRSVLATRDDDLGEARLDPTGQVLDADEAMRPRASALALLREAVLRRESARSGAARADPDTALDLWRGLIAGRWSLVDRFESDGKRFVVAHRNDPELGDPRGLSTRERQVAEYVGLGRSYKEIAYALGISLTSISNAVSQACRKLGLLGRGELASFFTSGGVRTRMAEFGLGSEHLAVGVLHQLSQLDVLTSLTEAEGDVLCDLVRGATITSIAERRDSSPHTVNTQVKAIYAKLGVGSRSELAARLETPVS